MGDEVQYIREKIDDIVQGCSDAGLKREAFQENVFRSLGDKVSYQVFLTLLIVGVSLIGSILGYLAFGLRSIDTGVQDIRVKQAIITKVVEDHITGGSNLTASKRRYNGTDKLSNKAIKAGLGIARTRAEVGAMGVQKQVRQ